MRSECRQIQGLFKKLCAAHEFPFPQPHKRLDVPYEPGVYIISKGHTVLHVGQTKNLHRRLMNHLQGHGASSFTDKYLNGVGATLRKRGYTYQFLVVEEQRIRALLELHAIGTLCPKHGSTGA